MNSIIAGDEKIKCFVCKTYGITEEHHIFGASDRNASEKYGLKVHLCLEHHKGTYGVHGREGSKLQQYLHEIGQEAYEDQKMKYKGISMEEARKEFRTEFRKSYL